MNLLDKAIYFALIAVLVFALSIFMNFSAPSSSCSGFKKTNYIDHELKSNGDFTLSITTDIARTIEKISIGLIELNAPIYKIDKNVKIYVTGAMGPIGIKGTKYEYNISIFYNDSTDTALCKGVFS